MIEQPSYSIDVLQITDRLFSAELEDDPWVLYHATSSLAEPQIDSIGFAGTPFSIGLDPITRLVNIYRRINWCGIHSDGYGALTAFALTRSTYPHCHTWFREASMRSLIYAQKSFAGGEVAMSFRQAYEDLQHFISSSEIQAGHLERQINECSSLVRRDGAPSRVIRVNIELLTAEFQSLHPVYELLRVLVQDYKYGVVYAVKLRPEDAVVLSAHGGNGILCTGTLPPDRIAGKAILHLDDQPAPWKTDSIEKLLAWSTSELYRSIAANARKGNVDVAPARASRKTPDWLGEDISLQIARQYGTPSILQMLDSGKIIYNEW